MKSSFRRALLVTGAFSALTVWMTWPLVLHMGDSVVGEFGDNMHFAWMIGWFKQALFDLGVSPYFAPQLNYPEGWQLARSEVPITLVLLGLPFAAARTPVLGYNVAALLSFIFSAMAMYAWIQRLTNDRAAAFLSGTIFAFLPYRIAHFRAGHLNAMGTFWFPLYFMALFELLQSERARWKTAALCGLSLGMISLTSQYYFYITSVASLFLVGGYLLTSYRCRLRSPAFWKNAIVAGLAGLLLAGLGTWPYIDLSRQGELPSRTVDAVASGSASVSDFLLPSTDHFLWGAWVGDNFNRDHWMEGSLYLGGVGLALAGVAWATGRRRADRRRLVGWLLVLAGLAMAISLGTHLYWNEQMVRLSVPDRLASMLGRETLGIRLPGYYLFQYFPFFDRMRTFKRTAILVMLSVSALAGLGAAWWRERLNPRWKSPLVVLLLGLVLLDFYPGPFEAFAEVKPRPVDLWLSAQPGDGAVAEFPFELVDDQAHVYYTLFHGKPYVGGFFNAFPPPQYQRIRPVMEGFPDGESVSLLQSLGVEYVLVERSTEWDAMNGGDILRKLGLQPAIQFDDVLVYTTLGD